MTRTNKVSSTRTTKVEVKYNVGGMRKKEIFPACYTTKEIFKEIKLYEGLISGKRTEDVKVFLLSVKPSG